MPPITCALFPDDHHVKTLKLDPAGAYTEDISYTWSEEPAGGDSRTTNPAFFVPPFVEIFDSITVFVRKRKTARAINGPLIPYGRGFNTPSVGLVYPIKGASIPYERGVNIPSRGVPYPIDILSLGHIGGIEALLMPYETAYHIPYAGHSRGYQWVYTPFIKGLTTLFIPYGWDINTASIPHDWGVSAPYKGAERGRGALIDIFNKKAIISRNNPTSNKFLLWEKN